MRWILVLLLAAAGAAPALAEDSVESLAKAAQNPLSPVLTAPLQNNFNLGMGPDNEMGYQLNIQPIIPIALSSNWNCVVRPILPILDIPLGGGQRQAGLGDLKVETFLSPNTRSDVLWGVGPMAMFPTATADSLGAGQWNFGPSLVAVVSRGPWVIGALITQTWSVAGESGRPPTSPFNIEPFVNYNLPHGWAIGTSPTFTADWKAPDDAWTVPLGGGISRTFKIARQSLSLSGSVYYNVVRPQFQEHWQLELTLSFLFPPT
ncbi:MAG: neuromedin U [Verrucomicrobiota bacterium]